MKGEINFLGNTDYKAFMTSTVRSNCLHQRSLLQTDCRSIQNAAFVSQKSTREKPIMYTRRVSSTEYDAVTYYCLIHRIWRSDVLLSHPQNMTQWRTTVSSTEYDAVTHYCLIHRGRLNDAVKWSYPLIVQEGYTVRMLKNILHIVLGVFTVFLQPTTPIPRQFHTIIFLDQNTIWQKKLQLMLTLYVTHILTQLKFSQKSTRYSYDLGYEWLRIH
jgi:hypothetical protein